MKVYPNKGQVQAQKVMIGYLHKVYIHILSNRYLIFFWLESIIKECKCGRLVKNFFLFGELKKYNDFFYSIGKKSAQPPPHSLFSFIFAKEKKEFTFFFAFFCTKPHTQAQFSIHTIVFILIIHFFSAILTATGNFLSLSKTYLILQKFPL